MVGSLILSARHEGEIQSRSMTQQIEHKDKVRARYHRMAPIGVESVRTADRAFVVDNSDSSRPLRQVAVFERGREVWRCRDVPAWYEPIFGQG